GTELLVQDLRELLELTDGVGPSPRECVETYQRGVCILLQRVGADEPARRLDRSGKGAVRLVEGTELRQPRDELILELAPPHNCPVLSRAGGKQPPAIERERGLVARRATEPASRRQ